ncbi:MAG: hypothetical protein N2167_06375 [Flavobacteriales bacterium]|nr:hypothetical protein [Flavobacteriales bacterium]
MRYFFLFVFCYSIQLLIQAQNIQGEQRKRLEEKNSETDKVLDHSLEDLRLHKVNDQAYQKMPLSWYMQQKNGWEKRVELNKNDEEAWLNYYRSAQYSGAKQQELDEIMKAIQEYIPGTFTAHYLSYIHSNRNLNKGYDLQKAWQLQPHRKELYKELTLFFTWKQEYDNLKKTLKTWKNLKDIPDALFSYGKNLLLTPSPGAILITDGEFDTYPLWILQQIDLVRTDVTVINLSLLHQIDYRRSLFKSAGILCSYQGNNKNEILQAILKENPTQSIYISLTVDADILDGLQNKLQIEGLAYKISLQNENQKDFREKLAANFEKNYNLDGLRKKIQGSETMDREKVVALYQNYVVCGLILYDYYIEKADKAKADKLAEDLKQLAKQAGKESLVNEYIAK